MQRRNLCLGLMAGLVATNAITAPSASAQTCELPPGFVDTPHPEIAPLAELVSRTEEVMIERPLAVVLDMNSKASPRQEVPRTSGMPGIAGFRRLTQGPFAPGMRRIVCLTDGSTVSEQVLIFENSPNESRFRYVVWNYTSRKFPPVAYGVGEFIHSAVGDSRTHVRWTYSFRLDRTRFPGVLGNFGDFIFREMFLERQFADWMREGLAGKKRRAEELPES